MIHSNVLKLGLLLGLFFIFQNTNYGQAREAGNSGIKGKVIDVNGTAIPFANIAVFSAKDSSLITGTATDMDGDFEISLKEGEYYLRLSFLSYKNKTIPNIKVSSKKLNLGKLSMQEDSKLLQEVEVTAERSQMELKLDKRVFNVSKDLSNVGSNAAEILDNIPSVEVDVEGNVSLRGSENVRVLIDGKPSTITAGNVGEALRQFQGNMIERVEVITNPSSRYDAEGEVGIINIVLKKEKNAGVNGSVELAGGYPDLFNGSFNLNYRTKKFNIFGSAGSSYRKSPGSSKSFREFNSPDTSYIYRSNTDRIRGGLSHNFRVGADWHLNEHNSLTLSTFYRKSNQKNTSDLTYSDLDQYQELFQKVNREDTESERGENFEYSLNYTKTFDKENQKFSADIKWSERSDLEESDIVERNYRTGSELLQETHNRESNKDYLLQADYVHPIGKDGKIETGFKGTLRTIENNFIVKEKAEGSQIFNTLEMFNNDFIYQENIFAYYAMFGNQLNRFSYQLGVRAEYSDVQTELKKNNEKNNWDYLDFFPSAHFTYKLNEEDDLQISYSRRISRPHFRHLLPFSNFSDQRSFWRGNPDLLPEYTDSYEIGYLNYFEKGSIFSSIYYRHRNQVINRITITDSNGVSSRLPINLAVEDNFGVELNGTYNFARRNSLSVNFNFYRSIQEGNYQGEKLSSDVYTWNSRISYKLRLPYTIDMQASLFYRAPRETTQGSVKALYAGDLSLAKDVLKGNGTVVFSVRDVLNSRQWRSEVETEYLHTNSEFQWRERQFLLSFTYRINMQKPRRPSRSMGGGDNDFDEGM